MLSDFMKKYLAYAAKVDGVIRVETIRGSAREVKQHILLMADMIVTCQEPECDCVESAWKAVEFNKTVDVVEVTVEEACHVEKTAH